MIAQRQLCGINFLLFAQMPNFGPKELDISLHEDHPSMNFGCIIAIVFGEAEKIGKLFIFLGTYQSWVSLLASRSDVKLLWWSSCPVKLIFFAVKFRWFATLHLNPDAPTQFRTCRNRKNCSRLVSMEIMVSKLWHKNLQKVVSNAFQDFHRCSWKKVWLWKWF